MHCKEFFLAKILGTLLKNVVLFPKNCKSKAKQMVVANDDVGLALVNKLTLTPEMIQQLIIKTL